MSLVALLHDIKLAWRSLFCLKLRVQRPHFLERGSPMSATELPFAVTHNRCHFYGSTRVTP